MFLVSGKEGDPH